MRGSWVVVARSHVFAGKHCPLCLKSVKVGQAVYFTHDQKNGSVVQHKMCMEAVLADPEVPVEVSEGQFSKVRDAIVASGNVFVEVG